MDRLISCEFNMDTACVELKFLDGSMIAIDTIAVENEISDNMYQRSELDSPDENKHMYHLNIEVLSHRTNKKHLLVFEKKDKAMYFVGEYRLTEMHQNVQPDENGMLRRVFVFHLTQVSDYFEW